MELVEGPTLADRIAKGPIPLDEALPIAKQIAEALETAHEQGIIHRDLKPANIKVRLDGTVKVLDFGLAKALEPVSSATGNATMSPTLSLHATHAGLLLGTAGYMAPEQARGRIVDRRADIWAFGCVLFEMLSGRPPFPGEDLSQVLARVIERDVEWNALPPALPAWLRQLLARCLTKDPKERLRDIGDARLEIGERLKALPNAVDAPAGSAQSFSVWRHVVPWAIAAGLALALAIVLARWAPWRISTPPAALRLEATLGADASVVLLQASLAISPDGATLAVVADNSQGTRQIYIRRLGELRATPLPNTRSARDPFFSPNGQWIAFFADGQLKKVAVTGGSAVTLCPAADDRGGTWTEDGAIVFQPAASGVGLMRVSDTGGTPMPLTTLGPSEITHRWPQVLPGGHAVLYTAHSARTDFENATIVVQPLPTGAPTIVQRGGFYGRYLRSGHLVYVRHGTLFAAPFDLARHETTGPTVPVIEGVAGYGGAGAGTGGSGSALVAWTDGGTAVYVAASTQNASFPAPMQWIDRSGKLAPLRAFSESWGNPQFSPDGRQLAVDIDQPALHLFVDDWARDKLTKITFDASDDLKPVWTPDGRRLVFRSDRDKTSNLYWARADGSGGMQRLTESLQMQTPTSWHPSGKFLAFTEARPETINDLMILPMEGDEASGWKPGKPWAFLGTAANESEPMFSPDGRWIAYFSNESTRFEVYVRPFAAQPAAATGGKWQISTDGGTYPTWSRTRHELVYLGLDNRLRVVSYTVTGDIFNADQPHLWSEGHILVRPRGRSYDLHPDGNRIVAAIAADNERTQDKLMFIFNFFDELRRIAPVK
jgi:serine/threonine-protein kinase